VRVFVSVFRLLRVFSRGIENVDLASFLCRFGRKSMYFCPTSLGAACVKMISIQFVRAHIWRARPKGGALISTSLLENTFSGRTRDRSVGPYSSNAVLVVPQRLGLVPSRTEFF
jgi:hypothetical protein